MDELISRLEVINLWDKYHPTIAVDAMKYDSELRQLPSSQPEIITCDKCKYEERCMWQKSGATYCSFAERREVTE